MAITPSGGQTASLRYKSAIRRQSVSANRLRSGHYDDSCPEHSESPFGNWCTAPLNIGNGPMGVLDDGHLGFAGSPWGVTPRATRRIRPTSRAIRSRNIVWRQAIHAGDERTVFLLKAVEQVQVAVLSDRHGAEIRRAVVDDA